MAQRLLLRRFLASVISRKPPQGQWARLTSRALQPPQGNPGDTIGTASQARSLYTTRVCTTTFNIQDGTDFQDRVVNSETPVVVDFHAQWCGPCKILGPRLEKVVAKQHGKVVMAKVDIDDHTDLAIEYEVLLLGAEDVAVSRTDKLQSSWSLHSGILGVGCAHRAGHQEWGCGGQVCGHQG